MTWAKIEVEFVPDDFPVDQVVAALEAMFTKPPGIVMATITTISDGSGVTEPLADDEDAQADRIYAMIGVDPGVRSKIDAIKYMRQTVSGLGLKEAKNAIDRAESRAMVQANLQQTANKLGLRHPSP